MINFQPYSNATNLEVIRRITRGIIQTVAPDEEVSASKIIDKLIKSYEEGNVVGISEDNDVASGFGDIDLITVVVVPMVISVLENLFSRSATLKNQGEPSGTTLSNLVETIVDEQYITISEKVKSEKSKSKSKILKQTTKEYVKQALATETFILQGDSTTDAPPPEDRNSRE